MGTAAVGAAHSVAFIQIVGIYIAKYMWGLLYI